MFCFKCILLISCLNTFCCLLNYRKQLFHDILNDYYTELRPVNDEQDTVFVGVSFTLMNIVELNEIEQSFTLNAQLGFHWYDVSLEWNPDLYNGITELCMEQQDVWLPDIFLTNSMNSRENLGFDDLKIVVQSDGWITWRPANILKFSCAMDVTYFPYDSQRCEIAISTWVTTIEQIDFEMTKDDFEILGTDFVPNGLWNFTAFDVEIDTGDVVNPTARLYLTFQRRPQYYIVNILIPLVLLSAVNMLVFLLPADSGEKIGHSMTVILSFVVFLTVLGNLLPATSLNTSYLTLYIATHIGLSCLSLVATVIILVIHHKTDDSSVPRCIASVVYCIRCVCCKSKFRTNKVLGIKDHVSAKKNISLIESDTSPESPHTNNTGRASLDKKSVTL